MFEIYDALPFKKVTIRDMKKYFIMTKY